MSGTNPVGSPAADVVTGAPPAPDEATRLIPAARPAPAPAAVDDDRTVVRPRATGASAPTQLRSFPPTTLGAPVTAPGTGAAPANADASLLPVGAKVAEFEVIGLIGQGGFGVVYRAWDHALEREVAIKEYFPSSLASRQGDGTVMPLSERHADTFEVGMRSFVNEARLLAQFDHPSLLKVYRFWQERGTTYMVMPLYKGNTLKSTLASMGSQVDEAWLLGVMDGVTQALNVMHQANCYHRDIAPDNIMLLEGSGLPVVLDFGAARRVISDMTQAITVILKPGYAPIEQYDDMPGMSQGAWTDVYALGAVMHVAVCGRPPPPSVGRLMEDRYIPLASNEVLSKRFSQRLLKSIDASLGVRPEARPQSMPQLRDSLGLPQVGTGAGAVTVMGTAAAAGARPAQTRGAPQKPASAGAGRGVQIAIAATVLLVLGGAGAWWAMRTPAVVSASNFPASTPPGSASQPAAVATAVPAALPAPVQAAFDAARALQELAVNPPGGFDVSATPRKQQVIVGKDKLEFGVRSNHEGFVYVYMLSSSGELNQLFPNQLDKRNQIKAGETMALPRPSWAMEAGGPPGEDQFVVVVSERERDFANTGLQNDGVFGQYSIKILGALEAARGGRGPSTLLGKPVCAGGNAPCSEVYGATGFKIVEQ